MEFKSVITAKFFTVEQELDCTWTVDEEMGLVALHIDGLPYFISAEILDGMTEEDRQEVLNDIL